jgi:hypothetical protein
MIKTPRPSPASAAWSSDSEDRGWRSSVHVTGASDAARALVVHHRGGLGVGPRAYDQTNLVVLCRSCHNDEYGLVHRRASNDQRQQRAERPVLRYRNQALPTGRKRPTAGVRAPRP